MGSQGGPLPWHGTDAAWAASPQADTDLAKGAHQYAAQSGSGRTGMARGHLEQGSVHLDLFAYGSGQGVSGTPADLVPLGGGTSGRNRNRLSPHSHAPARISLTFSPFTTRCNHAWIAEGFARAGW